MARKSCRASSRPADSEVTRGDRVAGVCGGIAGALIALCLAPLPVHAGGASARGTDAAVAEGMVPCVLTLLAYAGYGCFSLILARIDARSLVLPNRLVAAATLWTVPLLLAAALCRGNGTQAVAPLLGGLALSLIAWALWRGGGGGLGGGDVKLMPLAAYSSLAPLREGRVLTGVLVFATVFAVSMLLLALTARIRGRQAVAAGPAILASSWTTVVVMASTAVEPGCLVAGTR